jgi:rubredoxin
MPKTGAVFSNNLISEEAMMWRCTICRYIYDDAKEGTKFEDLPGDWTCGMQCSEGCVCKNVNHGSRISEKSSTGSRLPFR